MDLAAFLTTIGFVHVGNHVSKRVAYWRQNGINILINKEESGPTDSAYELHGTSVCDIALRVDDATSVIERARGLGAEVMEEKEGRDELKIPVIWGVGGGVIRFIDAATGLANWREVDFRPVETQSSATGLGLETIDHLAQTMNYEEMLTSTLCYTSILELKRVSMVDVIDPGGLVRSWTIQNPASDLRVTLNGAENQNTLAGQFIARTFGATVQHLAFSCQDIFATAEALAAHFRGAGGVA